MPQLLQLFGRFSFRTLVLAGRGSSLRHQVFAHAMQLHTHVRSRHGLKDDRMAHLLRPRPYNNRLDEVFY